MYTCREQRGHELFDVLVVMEPCPGLIDKRRVGCKTDRDRGTVAAKVFALVHADPAAAFERTKHGTANARVPSGRR